MPAYLLTLTTKNTAYLLSDLIHAINPLERLQFKQILIQAHPDNQDSVIVGDSNLSATRYGYSLRASESRLYADSGLNGHETNNKYLMCVLTDAQQVSVELVEH
jgi:hypothetical protein